MKPDATKMTAFFTGIWSALGFSAFDLYERLSPLSTQTHNILFLLAGALFFFIPTFLFVLGSQYLRYSLKYVMSQEYLSAFKAVTFRGICWFFGCAIGFATFSVIEGYFAT